MITDISWWALDGCCCFLVGSAWLLVLGVQAYANMQTCRHKKDQKSEAKKNTQSWV